MPSAAAWKFFPTARSGAKTSGPMMRATRPLAQGELERDGGDNGTGGDPGAEHGVREGSQGCRVGKQRPKVDELRASGVRVKRAPKTSLTKRE